MNNKNNSKEKYNENKKLIHFKNSNGYESWKEYDENSNLIHRERRKLKRMKLLYLNSQISLNDICLSYASWRSHVNKGKLLYYTKYG